jgi:muramoyltetrapeptide carboxypeptidase
MRKRILHLCAPASPPDELLEHIELGSWAALVNFVREAIDDRYTVRLDGRLLDVTVDGEVGGRTDDAARARDLSKALGDDRVAAIVTLRGGSWLTRILPQVEWAALKGRSTPVSVFGFSEITPMVNLVARYSMGRGYYDLGPAFIFSGRARYARMNAKQVLKTRSSSGKAVVKKAEQWARSGFREEFAAYFRDVVNIAEGNGSERALRGTVVRGKLNIGQRIRVVGGCLALLTAMPCWSATAKVLRKGDWLLLEDLEEANYRIDRQLAHLKLAGWFERCGGILLGDFHTGDEDQGAEVLKMLRWHLPKSSKAPIVSTPVVGHIWPLSPVPLAQPLTIAHSDGGRRGKKTAGVGAGVTLDW